MWSMKVRCLAPMRLGLAGGGTDIDAFSNVHGGYVLNVTISKYATTTIEDNEDEIIRFESSDMGVKVSYSLSDSIVYNGELDLLKAVYLYFMKIYNDGVYKPLTISTFCDAPPGSGLGASSTLMVSLVHAFAEYFNVGLGEYEIANLAFNIERNELGLAGGKQDQYSAAFGGFNFMEFYSNNRVIVNPLRVKESITAELESSLLLYYSGLSRESANVIVEQKKNVEQHKGDSISGLIELKNQAVIMKEAILTGNILGIVNALNKGWEAKKRTASQVTSTWLNEIYDSAIRAGALAGKISGAGGGGFFVLFVQMEKRRDVMDALESFGGYFINCTIRERGSFAWRVK